MFGLSPIIAAKWDEIKLVWNSDVSDVVVVVDALSSYLIMLAYYLVLISCWLMLACLGCCYWIVAYIYWGGWDELFFGKRLTMAPLFVAPCFRVSSLSVLRHGLVLFDELLFGLVVPPDEEDLECTAASSCIFIVLCFINLGDVLPLGDPVSCDLVPLIYPISVSAPILSLDEELKLEPSKRG